MGKSFKVHQERHLNGSLAHAKMLNSIGHQGNTDQTHTETHLTPTRTAGIRQYREGEEVKD